MLNRFIHLLVLATVTVWATAAVSANSLAHHPSPYLAMHADDPVDWQPWSEDALKRARGENKLIFISVGYFACHWCHVMQRESYRNDEIAETLNQHFISVKIDRELRPELDRRLIDFVEQVRGSAGWPLNVFLTPDGFPLTGFTYLPPETFIEVLLQLQQQWITRRDEISQAAQTFYLASIADQEAFHLAEASQIDTAQLVRGFVSQAMTVADQLQGGFGETSKFPQFPQLSTLLKLFDSDPGLSKETAEFIQLSLREMASRHLVDHLYGGFFRYTTDPDWQTPHYEKMLYDNAQLALLYLQAHTRWPDAGYDRIAFDTLDFILAEMKHQQGGFVSSLSAVDINDVEGGRYLWSREELKRHLSEEDYQYLSDLWHLQKGSDPFLLRPLSGYQAAAETDRNRKIKTQLLRVSKTDMPVDDKRLASWNALVLQALTAAAAIDENYKAQAAELYLFMRRQFFNAGRLIRFAGNPSLAETTFEDYAFVARAFQQYAGISGEKDARETATRLVIEAHRQFYRNGKWITDESSLLPSSPGRWLLQDGVVSSPLTFWLAAVLDESSLPANIQQDAAMLLQRIDRSMLETLYYYGSLIALRYGRAD